MPASFFIFSLGPPCRDFIKGLCTRGDACRYHHGGASGAGIADGIGGMNSGPAAVCRDFQRGRCERMGDCKYSHVLPDGTSAGAGSLSGGYGAIGSGAGASGYSTGLSYQSAAGPYAAPGTEAGANGITGESTAEGAVGDGAGAEDASMLASRKRAREVEDEAVPASVEGETAATTTGEDERPSKLAKTAHGDNDAEQQQQTDAEQQHAPSETSTDPSHLPQVEPATASDSASGGQKPTPSPEEKGQSSSSETRGADGVDHSVSNIEGIAGGPSVGGPGSDITTAASGIVDAGMRSAAEAPATADAPAGISTSGPAGAGSSSSSSTGGSSGGGGMSL